MASTALKLEVEKIMAALPETATIKDLLYALEVRAAIEEGLADSEVGRVSEVNEVRRRFGLQ
jgi:predicted transcriptional regulator